MTRNDSHKARPTNRLPLEGATGVERAPIFGLLDNVRSVWNVGSMFRTADAAGLGGLYLCGMTATPPRSDMEKTALGATETVPWDYWRDAAEAIAALRAKGVAIVALEQTADARPYDDFPCSFPACFVVGHEVRGVSRKVLDLADHRVEIPMAGVKRSLNVAVSFGVMAYRLLGMWRAGARGAEARR